MQKTVRNPITSPKLSLRRWLRAISSDGVIISDPDRKALWVNAAFTAQTGYVLDDICGKEPGSVLQGPETDPDAARMISLACAQRREVRLDVLNYTRDGKPFWGDLKVTPVYDANGLHTHFISTMRDISERKALEQQNEEMRHAEALRQSERQLLALTSEWLYSAKSFDELLMVVRRAMHTLIPRSGWGAVYLRRAAQHLGACRKLGHDTGIPRPYSAR